MCKDVFLLTDFQHARKSYFCYILKKCVFQDSRVRHCSDECCDTSHHLDVVVLSHLSDVIMGVFHEQPDPGCCWLVNPILPYLDDKPQLGFANWNLASVEHLLPELHLTLPWCWWHQCCFGLVNQNPIGHFLSTVSLHGLLTRIWLVLKNAHIAVKLMHLVCDVLSSVSVSVHENLEWMWHVSLKYDRVVSSHCVVFAQLLCIFSVYLLCQKLNNAWFALSHFYIYWPPTWGLWKPFIWDASDRY